MSSTIDTVRGMRDLLPPALQRMQATQSRLEAVLASYGYQPVDLPVVEQRDLYLRKLGEELVGKVYEFSFGGRELALRPEWTASVLRAYVANLQDQPLPLRLRYAGPVFRYERPQHLTYRQFTQVGVELIGGAVPRADAEGLALACAGLAAVQVPEYRVVVGHIGLVRDALARLGLTERTQGVLSWSLERLREHGPEGLRARLAERSETGIDPALLEGVDDAQAAALLLRTLRAMEVNLAFGTRPPEAIVGRLIRKLRRSDPQPALDRALSLLSELSQVRGAPAEALDRAEALLARFELPGTALGELRAVLDLAGAQGLPAARIEVDFGLGRGLHYYTGMIFEIYDHDGLQICGGGRYDDLVTALGGRQPVPAIGFAYGLERVDRVATHAPAPASGEILVVAVGDEDYRYALEVAGQLRQAGHVASVDVRGRRVADNLRDAARRELRAVVIVGPAEREGREVVWRDLAARSERRVALDQLGPGVEG